MISENGFVLENDVEMPFIGYGTYKVKENGEKVILDALEAGYRHLDTARKYGNEAEIGRALKESGLKRKEFFLTSKVWKDDLGYDATMRSFEASLKDLGVNYLDLFLIHWPMPNPRADWRTLDAESWRALEKLYNEGAVRAIGVSNFLPHHLMHLMKHAEIQPMVNQLEYHPGYIQQTAVNFSQAKGLQVSAWSPLGRTRVLQEPLLLELAEKYGKSPAQICIRFALQNNIMPLPKSSSLERMRENLDVFDFEITLEDMYRLMTLPQTGWSGQHPDTFEG